MKILLCIDRDPLLEDLIRALERSVQLFPSSEVVVLHVAARPEGAEGLVRRAAERLEHLPVTLAPVVVKGDPAVEIARVAETSRVELIVLGSLLEKRESILGSVPRKVVATAPADVLVVRCGRREEEQGASNGLRALLAVDGSLGSEAAIDAFARKLRSRCATARVLHVVESLPVLWEVGREPRAARESREAKAHEVLAWANESLSRRGIAAECEWRRGNPATQIVAAAREREADVIVLGSKGHSTIRELVLGGITHRVLRRAPCSVLCARGLVPASDALASTWMSENWEPGAGLA